MLVSLVGASSVVLLLVTLSKMIETACPVCFALLGQAEIVYLDSLDHQIVELLKAVYFVCSMILFCVAMRVFK